MNGINFLVSLAWAGGSKDVGDLMLEKRSGVKEFSLRPRASNQKINFVHLIFHLSRLSLWYQTDSMADNSTSSNCERKNIGN